MKPCSLLYALLLSAVSVSAKRRTLQASTNHRELRSPVQTRSSTAGCVPTCECSVDEFFSGGKMGGGKMGGGKMGGGYGYYGDYYGSSSGPGGVSCVCSCACAGAPLVPVPHQHAPVYQPPVHEHYNPGVHYGSGGHGSGYGGYGGGGYGGGGHGPGYGGGGHGPGYGGGGYHGPGYGPGHYGGHKGSVPPPPFY